MYGLQHSIHHFAVFDAVQSLPNMLNDAGYATALFGKYHVAPQANFNFSWGITPQTRCCGASEACSAYDYNLLTRNLTYIKECAVDFLDSAAENQQPWLMYMGFGDSHRCDQTTPVGGFCQWYGFDRDTNRSTIPTGFRSGTTQRQYNCCSLCKIRQWRVRITRTCTQ
jgi:N-sulfoglucosamine sulfohydrolase